MDASRYIAAKGNEKLGISQKQAIRMEIANALRDMADQIEGGARLVQQIQTLEIVKANEPPSSVFTIQTSYRSEIPESPKA